MALLEFFHHIGRNRTAKFGAALDGQAIDHAELYLARLDLIGQQHFERVLRHAGNHRADAVAAAHTDDELVELRIINKVVLCLHIRNALALAFDDRFKLLQNGLVDRHGNVLLLN